MTQEYQLNYEHIQDKFTRNIIKTLRKLSILYTVPTKVMSRGASITVPRTMGLSMEIEEDVETKPQFIKQLIKNVSNAFTELIINTLLKQHSHKADPHEIDHHPEEGSLWGPLCLMSLSHYYKIANPSFSLIQSLHGIRIMQDPNYLKQHIITSPFIKDHFHSSPEKVEFALYHLPMAEFNRETNAIDFTITFL